MSKSKSLNWKTTFAVAFLISLIILVQFFGNEIKNSVKEILESDWVSIVIWAYVGGIFLIHRYLYSSNELKTDSFIYKHFGAYADTIFGIATYGIAGTTSLALLKGLYLQEFYDGKYFFGFGTFDLVSMFLLTSFLLFYSIFNTTLLLKEVLFHNKTSPVEVKQ
ncbi:hypothetical protein RC94_08090 [Pectobacterium brasiliense]|uniref:hypothetical protein n=1 Tax=Pectobacterium brasiliense TaxID=180957 RepID=UPI0004E79AAE|nr:hypothetical protein [Pectobacterium brasiliense]KFF62226.1 hypothetical protein IW00_20165 [Pectobacterium brasiliense]KHS75237.1 hypothetical protein RC79_01110 [Pectobacterium brasiliense]KHT08772.1 hypothetical protein RC92_01085 [Pectobacterium brasiliense]KHT10821.1 hypothetical protein RC94_08090 [Pectobacterium brasiliense]